MKSFFYTNINKRDKWTHKYKDFWMTLNLYGILIGQSRRFQPKWSDIFTTYGKKSARAIKAL